MARPSITSVPEVMASLPEAVRVTYDKVEALARALADAGYTARTDTSGSTARSRKTTATPKRSAFPLTPVCVWASFWPCAGSMWTSRARL
jgi:hypothetical protein